MLEADDGLRLQGFALRDVLGRDIMCEDGIYRRVQTISYSHRYAEKVLINEIEEDESPGGAWVHALSLACQMHGKPLPTPEQKAAFSRMMSAFRFVPDREHRRGEVVTPSGLILRL